MLSLRGLARRGGVYALPRLFLISQQDEKVKFLKQYPGGRYNSSRGAKLAKHLFAGGVPHRGGGCCNHLPLLSFIHSRPPWQVLSYGKSHDTRSSARRFPSSFAVRLPCFRASTGVLARFFRSPKLRPDAALQNQSFRFPSSTKMSSGGWKYGWKKKSPYGPNCS